MVQCQRMEDENDRGGGGGGGLLDEEEEEELECKICYCPYSLSQRRPTTLHCCHRLCVRCLARLLALGGGEQEAPGNTVVCPFCRYVTSLPASPSASALPLAPPDDRGLLSALRRSQRYPRDSSSAELLLTPSTLGSLLGTPGGGTSSSFSSFSSPPPPPPPPASGSYASVRGSPNFVVITIMEPPPPLSPLGGDLRHHLLPRSPAPSPAAAAAPTPPLQAALMYRSSYSLDSAGSGSGTTRGAGCSAPGCVAALGRGSARALVWLLGLLYLCSLPLGVYLLIMQRTTLGVLLVSLVPSSITLVIIYGFCQCLCQELQDCTAR